MSPHQAPPHDPAHSKSSLCIPCCAVVTVCGTDAVLQCMIERNQSCMEEVCHKGACLLIKDRFDGVIYTLSSTKRAERHSSAISLGDKTRPQCTNVVTAYTVAHVSVTEYSAAKWQLLAHYTTTPHNMFHHLTD